MLKKIISGGQTGADRIGLDVAKLYGIPTGGTAAKGWMTEDGPDPELAKYGLVECDVPGYPPRTRKNVQDSDATVIFGDETSSGSIATKRACGTTKPCIINPTPEELVSFIYAYEVEVLNVAGNRGSILGIVGGYEVWEKLRKTFHLLGFRRIENSN